MYLFIYKIIINLQKNGDLCFKKAKKCRQVD